MLRKLSLVSLIMAASAYASGPVPIERYEVVCQRSLYNARRYFSRARLSHQVDTYWIDNMGRARYVCSTTDQESFERVRQMHLLQKMLVVGFSRSV